MFEGHPKLVLILNVFPWLRRHNQRGYAASHSRPLKARNVHGGGAIDAKGCQLSDHHAFQYQLFFALGFLHPFFVFVFFRRAGPEKLVVLGRPSPSYNLSTLSVAYDHSFPPQRVLVTFQ
jgi:hypothetical protein